MHIFVRILVLAQPLAEILGLDPADFEPKAVDLVRDPEQISPQKSTETRKKQPTPKARQTTRNGLRKDGQPDGQLKGVVPRIRLDMKLDEEVVAFLRSLKAPPDKTMSEGGYSGFVEEQVRKSEAFQRWLSEQKR
jgi:hypothetical protein